MILSRMSDEVLALAVGSEEEIETEMLLKESRMTIDKVRLVLRHRVERIVTLFQFHKIVFLQSHKSTKSVSHCDNLATYFKYFYIGLFFLSNNATLVMEKFLLLYLFSFHIQNSFKTLSPSGQRITFDTECYSNFAIP